MCWRPQPSLIRLGMYFLRRPVRFGVWYMRTSTRSCPNSDIRGVRRDAVDGSGVSRVPRRESVRMEMVRLGLSERAVRIVVMSSCSVLPM